MRYLKLITLLIFILPLSGCLKSSFESEEKRLSIFFEVDGLGETHHFGDETLEIVEFKFPLDRFNLYAANDVVLQTRGEIAGLIFAYTDQITQERLIIDIGLGFSDVTDFYGYEIFLEPLSSRGNIIDGDFFGTNQNYSVIIKGTKNGNEFELKSTLAFSKYYDLGNVQLTSNNETLIIQKTIGIKDVFTGQNGGLLDPENSEDESSIVNNIEQYLNVNAAAGSFF